MFCCTFTTQKQDQCHPLSVWQAEELIKREMIVMQRYDGLHDPVPSTSPAVLQQYQSYLETHPYQQVQEAEMAQVRS